MGSCKKAFRVSKIDTKKGRGRPQAYPESWKKKVIVLRSCGLDLKGIVEMLAEQDGLAFQAKIRRSQQIVQELLADERGKFSPPDKRTARRTAAFIRAKPCNGEQRAPLQSSHPPAGVFAPSATKTSTSDLSDQSMSLIKQSRNIASPEVISNRQNQTLQIGWDMAMSNNCTACGSVDQNSHLCWGPNMVAQGSSVFREETLHNLNQIGRRLSTTNKILANLKRLSNASYSSSFWSDVVSLIGRRYSWSSFGSADRYSVSALSESTTEDQSMEDQSIEDRVKKALRLRQQEDIKEMGNKALIQRCCKNNIFCIHKFLMELAKGDLDPPHTSKSMLNRFLSIYDTSNPAIDRDKTDVLFFAARVGAPANAILILMKGNVNPDFINNNGQTWLHCLDPRLINARGCCCGHITPHSTNFECIMFNLSPAFQFDRIDDHGRHFLFYICSSSTFDLSLLADLVQRHTEWAKRVVSASQIRDRAGLFLLDYISIHPGFSELSDDMRLLLQPNFDPDSHPPRILQDEDSKGRTDLHIHMEEAIFSNVHPALQMPFDDAIVRRQINRYDDTGHTPIMTLVEQAFKSGQEESKLCDRVRRLAAFGANVNARSRSGATILHFAAKKAAVQLLDVLLDQLGAQVDACDDKGHSATDCVTNIIKLSHSSKRPAELLARSIRTAVKILGATSGQSETSRRNPAITASHTNEADRPLKEILGRLRKPSYPEDHIISQLRRSFQGTT